MHLEFSTLKQILNHAAELIDHALSAKLKIDKHLDRSFKLNLEAKTSQNGQTKSNNLSDYAYEIGYVYLIIL